MPDSFSELRTAGGPNKPWVVGGVLALIVAIIGVALAVHEATRDSVGIPTPASDTSGGTPDTGAAAGASIATTACRAAGRAWCLTRFFARPRPKL